MAEGVDLTDLPKVREVLAAAKCIDDTSVLSFNLINARTLLAALGDTDCKVPYATFHQFRSRVEIGLTKFEAALSTVDGGNKRIAFEKLLEVTRG